VTQDLKLSLTWLLKYLLPIVMVISGVIWAHKLTVIDPAVRDANRPIRMTVLENNFMLKAHVTVEEQEKARNRLKTVMALEE